MYITLYVTIYIYIFILKLYIYNYILYILYIIRIGNTVQVLYKKVLYKNLRGSDPIPTLGSTLNSSWHGATTCLSYYSVVRVYSFLVCWSVALLFSSTWPGLYIFIDILTANSYTLVLQAATNTRTSNEWDISLACAYGCCLWSLFGTLPSMLCPYRL